MVPVFKTKYLCTIHIKKQFSYYIKFSRHRYGNLKLLRAGTGNGISFLELKQAEKVTESASILKHR